MTRQAVVVPGSSSWWLLTLSPLLYFDKVRISSHDLSEIETQREKSSYNFRCARILELIRTHAEESLFVVDSQLPRDGRSGIVTDTARRMAFDLVQQAEAWRPSQPTIVRPSEIKNVLTRAYAEWIRYNKRKTRTLRAEEGLRKELEEKQIPRWEGILKLLRSVPARAFPEHLDKDADLMTVFTDVIRNGFLLTSVTQSPLERAYDALALEFLPAAALVERHRIFGQLQNNVSERISVETLIRLYDLRMARLGQAVVRQEPDPELHVIAVLKARKRFETLRRHLSEIDERVRRNPIQERDPISDLVKLVRSLQKEVGRIEKTCDVLLWAGRTYCLTEFISSLDDVTAALIRLLVSYPLVTNLTKEVIRNFYLSARGMGTNQKVAITVLHDYLVAGTPTAKQIPMVGKGTFSFWV